MIDKLLEALKGKKTYLYGALTVLLALMGMGGLVDVNSLAVSVEALIGALGAGIIALRRVSPKHPE